MHFHPGATIGKGLFIDHGSGVIIGETAILGDNITLYQGVTLGGTGKEQGKRHPTLEDNVMVSAGAKVIGSFTIGKNSKIGAGSVVIEEVPPNCTVVGVPGRIVRMGDQKVPSADLDQIHLPDRQRRRKSAFVYRKWSGRDSGFPRNALKKHFSLRSAGNLQYRTGSGAWVLKSLSVSSAGPVSAALLRSGVPD